MTTLAQALAQGGHSSFPDPKQASVTLPKALEALAPYVVQASSLQEVTEATAPKVLSSLTEGLMVAGTYYASALYKANETKVRRKEAEAIAALDQFPEWCTRTGNKGTADMRSAFVNMDARVMELCLEEGYLQALVEQLSSIKMAITMALSSTRSIAYGYRDSSSVSGGKMF